MARIRACRDWCAQKISPLKTSWAGDISGHVSRVHPDLIHVHWMHGIGEGLEPVQHSTSVKVFSQPTPSSHAASDVNSAPCIEAPRMWVSMSGLWGLAFHDSMVTGHVALCQAELEGDGLDQCQVRTGFCQKRTASSGTMIALQQPMPQSISN